MSKFNEGDKVRVISEHTLDGVGYREVEVGDIVTVGCATGFYSVPTYQVRRADGGISVIDATCLELVVGYTFDPGGEKIAFEGVRVGDTIAALTYGQWRVAEVSEVSDNFLGDAKGECIAYGDSDTTDIRLLHRPEAPVDREQVDALTALLVEEIPEQLNATPAALTDIAIALVKAGVSVDV